MLSRAGDRDRVRESSRALGFIRRKQSFFGGSAWQLHETTGEYYLHLFAKKQADLNWENAVLREEIYKLMRFWLAKGVDGLRLDVISAISKRVDFPDTNTNDFNETIRKYYSNLLRDM